MLCSLTQCSAAGCVEDLIANASDAPMQVHACEKIR